MSSVLPFPYSSLPKVTQESVQLRKKLLNAYYFFESHQDILKELSEPLREILKTPVPLEVTCLESAALEHLVSGLPEKTLLVLFRLEPHAKKAALVFETLLAKILIHMVLSGDRLDQKRFRELQLKPLTFLEEAVVQYIFVSVLERLSSRLSPKTFSIVYDDVVRDPKRLMGSFSVQDPLGVFSFKLHLLEHDFYLKLVLPISTADHMRLTKLHKAFVKERLTQFGNFDVPLELEAAGVDLEPADLDGLDAGDIVMFDEASLWLKEGGLEGQARVRLVDHEGREGYLVDVETAGEAIRARIVSAL